MASPSELWRNLCQRICHFSGQLGWIEMIYPVLLGSLLFAPLTFLIYSGQRHTRLAGQAEGSLLIWNLRLAASPNLAATQSLVVTIDRQDLTELGRTSLEDIQLTDLTPFLKQAEQTYAARTFINWSRPVSIQQLKTLQAQLDFPERVALVIDRDHGPIEITRNQIKIDLLYNLPCLEGVQTFCSYAPDVFNGWVIDELTLALADPTRLREALTTDLPSFLPAFLLRLPSRAHLPEIHLRSFSSNQPASEQVKYIFIGFSKDLVPFTVETATAQPQNSPEVPYHVFWAQLAEMMKAGLWTKVLPEEVSYSVAALLGSLIMLAFLGFGATAGLIVFFLSLIGAGVVNLLMLNVFNTYLLPFSLFFGIIMIAPIAIFFRLSFETFRRFQLDLQRSTYQETSHIKANFTSLLSHNLNTPIAKLSGMLDLMRNLTHSSQSESEVQDLQAIVARLQWSIRVILVTTAMDDRSLNVTALSLKAFIKEIDNQLRPVLSRSRIDFYCNAEASDPELLDMPLKFDIKILMTALGSLLFVLANPEQNCQFSIRLRLQEVTRKAGTQYTLCMIVHDGQGTHFRQAWDLNGELNQTQTEWNVDRPFFDQLLIRLIRRTLRLHRGNVRSYLSSDGGVSSLNISLHPLQGTELA